MDLLNAWWEHKKGGTMKKYVIVTFQTVHAYEIKDLKGKSNRSVKKLLEYNRKK